MKTNPLWETWTKTKSLIKSRKYEEALICYDNFFTNYPKIKAQKLALGDLWIWRGECLRRLGKFNEAIESYKKGLEIMEHNNEVAGCGMELAKEKITRPIYL